MTGGWYTYDLKNQCWEPAREINAAIDVSQLYEKIDLSKTELMRDKDGNPCGGWKNTSIKYMAASDVIWKRRPQRARLQLDSRILTA